MSLKNNIDISVVMLVASLPPMPAGGAERQALKLAEELAKMGIQVIFVTPGRPGVKGMTRIAGLPVYRLHSWMNALFSSLSAFKKNKRPFDVRIEYDDARESTTEINNKVGWPTVFYYNIFFLHALLFLWRRRKTFDIIHAHTMEWSAIVSARLGRILRKPVVIKDSTMNGFGSLARFPFGKNLQTIVMRNAYFIAMTKVIHQNLLQSGIGEERIFEIPNGMVIVNNLPRADRDLEPQVLFVGNLYQQPAKGVDILLNAWRMVHAQFPRAKLNIIGDGVVPAYKNFTDRLKITDTVNFLGKQEELAKFYASSDIFVLPSRREGMPNVLMEAMLSGVPCIATNISGARDLISNNENGIIVPPGDPDRLANGILYMLLNPDTASVMGAKGRETIIRDFNIVMVAEKYASLYEKLLHREGDK